MQISVASQTPPDSNHDNAEATCATPWPREVLDFTLREHVAEYLGPLVEMTKQVFPSYRQLVVSVEEDPEIADDQHVVFDIEATGLDVKGAADAHQAWHAHLLEICPPTLACAFCLRLELAH